MNIKQISRVNLERALIWHKGGLEEWSAADWSNAMAGESGEVCNAVKKLRRIECGIRQAKGPHTIEEATAEIAKEIGDTYLYLDLLAQRLSIDLSKAIVDTFNRVSEREGFPQRLELVTDVEMLFDRIDNLQRSVRNLLDCVPLECECDPDIDYVCAQCTARRLVA